MNIGEVCSREVYILKADEPLANAVAEMVKRHIGAIVVVETEPDRIRPVGIVTDRDVIRGQVSLKKDLPSLTLRDVMTSAPLTVSETSGVAEAIERMKARAVRMAPSMSRTSSTSREISARFTSVSSSASDSSSASCTRPASSPYAPWPVVTDQTVARVAQSHHRESLGDARLTLCSRQEVEPGRQEEILVSDTASTAVISPNRRVSSSVSTTAAR